MSGIDWAIQPPVPTVFPGSPNARRTDPVESHEAADSITPDVTAASQAAVLNALGSVLYAVTDQEIAHLVNREQIRFSESRLRTARHELEEMGVVRHAGRSKPPGARTYSRTWELTGGDEERDVTEERSYQGESRDEHDILTGWSS